MNTFKNYSFNIWCAYSVPNHFSGSERVSIDWHFIIFFLFQAGISKSKLTLALEPEAASIYCNSLPLSKFVEGSGLEGFEVGHKYLVLDAGGKFHYHFNHAGIWVMKSCRQLCLIQIMIKYSFLIKPQHWHPVVWHDKGPSLLKGHKRRAKT